MDLEALHHRTVSAFVERVTAVGDGQWSAPTPCEGWSVHDLVNHVVGEDLWTEPLLRGRTIEDVGDAFDGDLLGARPAEAARAAGDSATTGVAERLPQGGTVHLSYGEEKVEEYVWQLTTDHLVHAWDLAVAVGGDTRFDPAVVEAVAGWFAGREEMYRKGGVIAERVRTDSDDPQDRLIARFGRDPAWSPA